MYLESLHCTRTQIVNVLTVNAQCCQKCRQFASAKHTIWIMSKFTICVVTKIWIPIRWRLHFGCSMECRCKPKMMKAILVKTVLVTMSSKISNFRKFPIFQKKKRFSYISSENSMNLTPFQFRFKFDRLRLFQIIF